MWILYCSPLNNESVVDHGYCKGLEGWDDGSLVQVYKFYEVSGYVFCHLPSSHLPSLVASIIEINASLVSLVFIVTQGSGYLAIASLYGLCITIV